MNILEANRFFNERLTDYAILIQFRWLSTLGLQNTAISQDVLSVSNFTRTDWLTTAPYAPGHHKFEQPAASARPPITARWGPGASRCPLWRYILFHFRWPVAHSWWRWLHASAVAQVSVHYMAYYSNSHRQMQQSWPPNTVRKRKLRKMHLHEQTRDYN